MTAKPRVAIVGLMGAGKSTVGAIVARRLGIPFLDTDALLVASSGKSVVRIFAEEGEPAFRDYEFEAAQRALGGEPAVVALGGGALTHEPTRDLVASRAVRVYLEVGAATVLRRLQRSRTERPLVGDEPTLERINELLEQRERHYREAELRIVAEGASAERVAERVIHELEAHVHATSESGDAAP